MGRPFSGMLRVAGVAALALAVVATSSDPSHAQTAFPRQPLTIVVPFAPGGAIDVLARMLAQRLGPRLNQSVIVQNMPGATGQIGVDFVARSNPDGHIAVMGASGGIVINPHLRKLPYDPLKDLTLVTLVSKGSAAFAIPASLPANSFQEFATYVRANPNKVFYAVSGVGSQFHVAIELLKLRAGLDMTAVPYKGSDPAIIALVSGEVQAGISGLSSLQPHVEQNKIRILAITDSERTEAAPDIPTVAETGVADFAITGPWNGLFLPSRTPPEIVKRWHTEVTAILREPDMQKAMFKLGAMAAPHNSLEEAENFIRTEYKAWKDTIEATKLKLP